MFVEGQRVVCIDDKFPAWVRLIYKQLPKKDSKYTIRKVCMRREKLRGSEEATVAVLLQELGNPPDPTHKGGEELAFRSERFAPLEEIAIEEYSEKEELIFV